MKRNDIVIGLSGGMDSTTLLAYFLNQGFNVHCCFFVYGSKHNKYEEQAVHEVIEYFRYHLPYRRIITYRKIDLIEIFRGIKSNLLSDGGPIPEGHYESDEMKATKVPGRNLIISSILASMAENIGAQFIGLGVHGGDHVIYPDCRADFISSLSYTIALSTESKVEVATPFLYGNKETILRMGYDFKISVPYHLTRTCYKDQQIACGKCGSCQERLEAFKLIGKTDPIEYENFDAGL